MGQADQVLRRWPARCPDRCCELQTARDFLTSQAPRGLPLGPTAPAHPSLSSFQKELKYPLHKGPPKGSGETPAMRKLGMGLKTRFLQHMLACFEATQCMFSSTGRQRAFLCQLTPQCIRPLGVLGAEARTRNSVQVPHVLAGPNGVGYYLWSPRVCISRKLERNLNQGTPIRNTVSPQAA